MSLSRLPNELIEEIAHFLPAQRDVAALVLVNRRFHGLLNQYLYRRNHAAKFWHGDALFWAASTGRVETLLRAEALGVPVPAQVLVAEAAVYGTLDVVEHLLPRLGRALPLVLALENGNWDVFALLVERGADLTTRGSQGETALHIAADRGLLAAAELLVGRGAEVDARDENGQTPLHWACHRDEPGLAGFLLEKGADVEAEDDWLDRPLHVAAEQGCLEAVRLLLSKGAQHSPVNGAGWTPALAAVEGRSAAADAVVRLLNEAGAD